MDIEKFFILRENAQNLRNFQETSNENMQIVKYGIETISNRALFLWANLPNEYKQAISLHGFQLKIINRHYMCSSSQKFSKI